MKYRIRRKDDKGQLILQEGKFIVSFKGRKELKELIKYANIALGMEDDPRKPCADLRIIK